VTLRATLEILNYLIQKRSFSYLMTSRLNQDNLEVNNSHKENLETKLHIDVDDDVN
jgi:hypothetical protein